MSNRQVGRPPTWKTPEELSEDIDLYLEDVKTRGVFAHKKGFAAWKNCAYDTVFEYLTNKGQEFSEPIKRLETMAESLASDMMVLGKSLNGEKIDTTGSIFVAKNLLRETFEDKQRHESKVEVTKHEVDPTIKKLQESEEGRELLAKMYEQVNK